jgi:hypothetical protein
MQSLPLTDLPAALIGAGFETPNYRALYEAARSAVIPVIRNASGRWAFRPDDIPRIATSLKLSPLLPVL